MHVSLPHCDLCVSGLLSVKGDMYVYQDDASLLNALTLCGRNRELTAAKRAAVSGESLWPQITI